LKKTIRASVLLIIFWQFVPALVSGQNNTDQTFRCGLNEPVSSLFPPEGYGLSDLRILPQIFEGLVAFSDDGKNLIPSLAKSWQWDSTASTLTFHLRTDAWFHDDPCFKGGRGRPVVASDFEFVFRYLCREEP